LLTTRTARWARTLPARLPQPLAPPESSGVD
jgi:hypothetical protein